MGNKEVRHGQEAEKQPSQPGNCANILQPNKTKLNKGGNNTACRRHKDKGCN